MKHLFLRSGLLTAALFAILAFKSDQSAITINITSPTKTSAFKTRDTVRIKADITASEALHNVIIKVLSLKDSTIVFSKQIHSHSTSMHVNEFYINPVVDEMDMKLIISTTGHEGHETAKSEMIFVCKARKK